MNQTTNKAVKNATVNATSQATSSLIVPGRSIGPVQLGDTREYAQQVFGAVFGNKYYDEYTYQYSQPCWPQQCCEGVTQMHWLDYMKTQSDVQVQNGIYVYVSKGRVIQIVAATNRYATANGITSSSSPDQIRRQYPNLQSFVRLGYHTEAEGGRDIVFWDDLNGGIAFEFWYSRTSRQRYLEAIIVHEPGAQLLPEGCLESPSEWQKLKPYFLEPPNSN
ncbi:MAG: hypothetical protein AUG51_19710 [Acidobacteria bacterium 13_1_20CM_3_53_8]|nr:MAG: hypothetical protein AUG51_19710 [Acidobacteria bacterium 13_1_20CM_3_53_8]